MHINTIKSYRDVVAICDSELLGKSFEQGKFCLDVKENFFKGDGKKHSEEEVIEKINDFSMEDATFNIVGERAVNTAIKAELIKKNEIQTIQGVPFALVLL